MFEDSFFTWVIADAEYNGKRVGFRPHVWGFFFHKSGFVGNVERAIVFVPMFGDSFFTIVSHSVIPLKPQ